MAGYRYRTKIPTKTFVSNLKAQRGYKPGQVPLTRREMRFLVGPPTRPKQALLSKRFFGKDISKKEFATKMGAVLPPSRTSSVIRKHRQPPSIIAQKMTRGRRPIKFRPSTVHALRNPRVLRKLFRA